MREHTALVLGEHGYAMAPPEALRWAIDDHSPGWVSRCEKTQASLMKCREALLIFHRESKRARYRLHVRTPRKRPLPPSTRGPCRAGVTFSRARRSAAHGCGARRAVPLHLDKKQKKSCKNQIL